MDQATLLTLDEPDPPPEAFQALADNMPSLCWIARPDGYIFWYNRRWHEYTGTSPAQMEGWGWQSVHDAAVLPQVLERWRGRILRAEPFEMTFPLRRADGAFRPHLTRVAPWRDGTGQVQRWFGVNIDVSAQIEAEAALRELNLTLEARIADEVAARQAMQARVAHAERIQALGQLAGGIAHDFNNVLQAIQGAATLLQRRPDDPAAAKRLTTMMLEATRRGAAVTSRLLTFARQGDLRCEPIDPVRLLAGMREILACALGPQITLAIEAPEPIAALLADRDQLETAIVNLATNARDALDGRGRLLLSAAEETVSSGTGHLANLAPGAYVKLTVADNGPGMEPETLARALEPFFTTKPVGRGTGLGLSMVQGFAKQSGGALAIESAPGAGTTASLWLPRAPIAAEPRSDPAPPQRCQGTVLLVDDEPMVRDLLAEQLQGFGFSVLKAAGGAESLALIEAGARVDALVTDLSMPQMDGIALIRGVKQRHPDLPAVLLTGYAGDAAMMAAANDLDGAFVLLRKPTSGAELAIKLRTLLEPTAAGN